MKCLNIHLYEMTLSNTAPLDIIDNRLPLIIFGISKT